MRAVLDPNVLIAALLSRDGAPARVLAHWLAGSFELIVSAALLEELARALSYPKLRARVLPHEAEELRLLLERCATVVDDVQAPAASLRSEDPGDDYLLALAEAAHAVLVSGDAHLLSLSDRLPIRSARRFLETLDPLT